jgi:hypothetical protein
MAMPSSRAHRVGRTVRPRATSCARRQVACTYSGAVTGFDGVYVERLQKQLANELHTDPAATPITQNTRLPGFFYLKSPVAGPCGTARISQGLTYAAVTHSRRVEARYPRPRASSFSPGASLLVCRPKFGGVKADRTASTSKAVRSA